MRAKSIISLLFGIVIISACQVDFITANKRADIDSARYYFENTAESLDYPVIAGPKTRSGLSGNDIVPDWENAKVFNESGKCIIQVPLGGHSRLKGAIAHVHCGKYEYVKSSCNSYLVFDYTADVFEPAMCIFTTIGTGYEKKSKCWYSDLSGFDGVAIISTLGGEIEKTTLCHNGRQALVNPIDVVGELSQDLPENAEGVVFRLFRTCPVTKGGDFGNNEETDGEMSICPFCGRVYFGHEWTPCPDCGIIHHDDYMFCGNCLEPLDKCICDQYKECPYCHKLIGVTCNCDGGSNPEKPGKE